MPHLAGLQSLTYGNGLTLSLNYDGDGRLTDMRAADGTTEVQDLTLTYDPAANITAITDNLDPARSQAFGYDGVDRLTHASGPYGAVDYTYDLVGNRTHRTIDDGTLTDEVYAYSAGSHRLASLTVGSAVRDFGYTAAGSTSADTRSGTTLSFTYNHSGRLRSVTAQAGPLASREYWYDALEHRVHEIREDRVGQGIDTAEFSYVYDLSGHLLAEYATDGLAPQVLREYIWLDDTPVAMIDHTGPGDPQLLAIHTDHLGRPQKLTDASQAVVWDGQFDPFGEEYAVASTTDMPLRFPGQEWDAATALSQNWNRDYDPTLGRYIESDPIGLAGGMNTYMYVGGNPLQDIDSFGLYGTNRCRYYTKRCREVGGRYYCETAKAWCPWFWRYPDPDPCSDDDYEGWSRCTRQCLQDWDAEYAGGRPIEDVDDFWDGSHFYCHVKCYSQCLVGKATGGNPY
ncbi:MAG: RHS domain-containing protein [Deltaproteobacteria bacterium]|nr:RHS domain-containing protein [Deltaproteobacteria bacterium]